MSRRDTILIAVLLNMALLVVLFATAIKTDHSEEPIAKKVIQEKAIEPVMVKAETPAQSLDEVDALLSQYAKVQEAEKEEVAMLHEVAPPSSVTTTEWIEVRVKKGDSLDKIARANGSTINAIKRANNLTTTCLQIGQILKVPVGGSKGEVAPPASSESPLYYTVKSGESPWVIAAKNHMKVDELLRLNNLNEESALHLKPGDKLRIR